MVINGNSPLACPVRQFFRSAPSPASLSTPQKLESQMCVRLNFRSSDVKANTTNPPFLATPPPPRPRIPNTTRLHPQPRTCLTAAKSRSRRLRATPSCPKTWQQASGRRSSSTSGPTTTLRLGIFRSRRSCPHRASLKGESNQKARRQRPWSTHCAGYGLAGNMANTHFS